MNNTEKQKNYVIRKEKEQKELIVVLQERITVLDEQIIALKERIAFLEGKRRD